MLDWIGYSLRIDLSKSAVRVVRVSRSRRSRISVVNESKLSAPIDTAQHLTEALHAALSGIDVRSRWISIVLADEWVRYFSVASPVNMTRLADCKAVAALRFQRLYDLSATDWHIEATWSANQHFLACAVPRWLIEALTDFATQRKSHLIGIVPQFVDAWNQWRAQVAPDSWFGLAHHGRITFSALQGRRPVDAETIFLASKDSGNSSWLEGQLKRNALLQGRAVPTRFYLCGGQELAWTTSPDDTFQVIRLDSREALDIASPQSVLPAMQG